MEVARRGTQGRRMHKRARADNPTNKGTTAEPEPLETSGTHISGGQEETPQHYLMACR